MEKIKIAIGSDHGGFNLKRKVAEFLTNEGYEVNDVGTHSTESCDYPIIARDVAKKVASGEAVKGIILCGSGVGVSIVANKVKGIRAALCHESYTARVSREHNDSNILCMGERVTGDALALDIVKTWLDTPFEGGRHKKRVDMIEE